MGFLSPAIMDDVFFLCLLQASQYVEQYNFKFHHNR